MDAFQQFLTDWLAHRQWSVNRLGQEADVSQSLISRWLHSDPRRQITPRPNSLRKLAPVLGVEYEDLMRMCGYLPSTDAQPQTNTLDPDVAAISGVWSSLDEGIQRAVRILVGIGPVSAPGQHGFSARPRGLKRGKRANDGNLTSSLPAPHFALFGAH